MKSFLLIISIAMLSFPTSICQIAVYTDNVSIVTGHWNGNGTLSEVTSNTPCEGNKHYQFQYSITDWWAGFGLNLNNWAPIPGISYNLTNYTSVSVTYKGLQGAQQLRIKLGNRYDVNNPVSNEVLIGGVSPICTTVNIAISELLNNSTFNIASVTELEFSVGGAISGTGTVFIDNIQFIPQPSIPCSNLVTNNQNIGIGSLRQCIDCNTTNSIIEFSNDLSEQIIQLDAMPILIDKNISIQNNSGGNVTLSSALGAPIFSITSNGVLSLENIYLVGKGSTLFQNQGNVSLKNVDIILKNDTIWNEQGNIIIDGNVNVVWENLPELPEELSDFIVVDQFGYRNDAQKIAIIRKPMVGYDNVQNYTPSSSMAVINSNNQQIIFSGEPFQWNNGITDPVSGDKVWWFDFSQVTTPGNYYILDQLSGKRSFNFVIANDVYKNVLKTAFKTFYYQRSGFLKTSEFAGNTWADGASHLQDQQSRSFLDKLNITTEKDLSGGWYDAGDYNKYTAWHASYIVSLLQMFKENPNVWTDDFGIPESGNGIPDILDEVLFGLQWLYKMQQSNGSCLSVVGVAHSSPPSTASGPSYYGLASTFATLRCAEAFAYSAYIFNAIPQLNTEVASLITKAELAWNWANSNPNVIFPNNVSNNNTVGLAAGNQETNDLGRLTAKLGAALYLYQATNNLVYKSYFEANYHQMPLLLWGNYISQYFFEQQDILLEYCELPDASVSISNTIKNTTNTAMKTSGDFANIVLNNLSAYRAFIKDYNWGSNQYKANYGNFFNLAVKHTIDVTNNNIYTHAAESYLHYIHGSNPFNMVFLTNMTTLGADKQISQFYHSWFADGSAWDTNPAPGFLAGGPNQYYAKDACCATTCANNPLCFENLVPPLNQPPMKSYKDFNTSWPQNSWQISENSNGYQVAYLRLLSKFVE
jgi:hypothetical protein